MRDKIVEITATWFYTGYSPVAPGTAGTAAAVVFYLLLFQHMNHLAYSVIVVLITVLGIYVSSRIVEKSGEKDPSYIVVDEVTGYLVTMLFVPHETRYVILGFILFRVFDIVKPFPARRLEKVYGGYGIVLDDVAAGLWSNIILHLISIYVY